MSNAKQLRDMLMASVNGTQTEPELIETANFLKTRYQCTQDEFDVILSDAIRAMRIDIGESYTIEDSTKRKPWFEEYYKDLKHTRWDRYESYLISQKSFPIKVVRNMKESLMKIIDLSGNPNGDNFSRKGLVVGDVQSGKTANYVGLMNLAADTNYKVIVVLTGTTNTLREQTQIRIEEGLGVSQSNKGVMLIKDPNYSNFIDPVYLTSRTHDFSTKSMNTTHFSIEATSGPIVIVTKKNSTALSNINNWLISYSKNKNSNMINSSLLLIDDEADFASVNTKKDDEQPTVINRRIREILNLFTKSSYIGFTATPYANIFIEPSSNEEMYGQDLFPKDYIYVLGESEDYMGVQTVFSDDNTQYPNILQELDETEINTYLPLKHKKDTVFNKLPKSLKHAINVFLLANTIRDGRGHINSHRSMLINISRFVNLHDQIKDTVHEYVDIISRDVRLYSKLPVDKALKNNSIKALKESFESEYKNKLNNEINFEDILPFINDAIYRIKVVIVNSNNKDLDYLQNEEQGERVIVIGGFALSRGLTLEGLVVSYYYRNSVMYDSLLQMGRWFGYRNGYADLCRIYMTDKVISDFKFIALATTELKDDLAVNSRRGLTPIEFGIKVRSGQVGLIITARNKMGTAKDITARATFSKDIIETTVFSTDLETSVLKNINLIKELVERNIENKSNDLYPGIKNGLGLTNVDKNEIIWFLQNYISVDVASRFDSKLIIDWLQLNNLEQLDKWDIAFATGSSDDISFDYGNDITGMALLRTVLKHGEYESYFRNSSSRLGSPSDGRYGLKIEEVNSVKDKFNRINSGKNISQKEYFSKDLMRKPLLVIYSVVPQLKDMNPLSYYVPLISVGIPEFEVDRTKYVEYKVNKIYMDLESPETEDE